jgi:hypothetical protein
MFDHNYEHDNNCQGFFTKDGDVTDATLYDNLFVRDQAANEPEANMDIWNVYDLTIRNNTSWPGAGDIIRDVDLAHQPRATVDHNVFEAFANGCCEEASVFRLREGHNVFDHQPTFRIASTDAVLTPAFVSARGEDYRLASNPHRIGVDWRPADQHYGPPGDG